jgi:signal transduction histidine kinase
VKHTPAGGTLTVALQAGDGTVIGTVRDRAPRGTGLGLAIGRWIVETHGGHITVESDGRRGSSFHVRLPHR